MEFIEITLGLVIDDEVHRRLQTDLDLREALIADASRDPES